MPHLRGVCSDRWWRYTEAVANAPNHCGGMPCDDSHPPGDEVAALRIVDANLNRASEGLRVVEDYCRFALDDSFLSRRCKHLRHRLAAAVAAVSPIAFAAARETVGDVGVGIKTPAECERNSLAHIATASWQRVQQALRVIEEALKLLDPQSAAKAEALRYESYTLDKACRINAESHARLAGAKLYVLVAGGNSECAFVERVQELLAAGVHILQLRDKRLDDRTLLGRARLLRQVLDEWQRERESGKVGVRETNQPAPRPLTPSPPLLIINDRPDLAVLSRADGVHVGQDELSVHDARQIVGPDRLIGVSTHSLEQARQAVLDGANYIGCGPTFPSDTKEFESYPGPNFLRQVAAEISLPAFAIGGIALANLALVFEAGFTRIAVGGASAEAGRMAQVLAQPQAR